MILRTRSHKSVLWVVSLLICSSCATLKGDSFSKYNDQQLVQIGEKFLAARDFGQGLKFLTAAESRRPGDPKIQYLLGLGYAERGLEKEALVRYQKAIQLKPDYSEVYNALGGLYIRQGLTDKAEEAYKKALANPFYDHPHLPLYNLGVLYEKKGDPDGALNQYKEAVRLQPTYGLVYYRMGIILENSKRGDQAREAYAMAIRYEPDLAEAHLRYGIMCYLAGEIETALYSLNRVVRIAPESSLAAEAKKYLSRMGGVVGSSDESSAAAAVLPPERLSRIEVMKERDLKLSDYGSSAEQSTTGLPKMPSDVTFQESEAESPNVEQTSGQEQSRVADPRPAFKSKRVISQGIEATAPKINEAEGQEVKATAALQPGLTETTQQTLKPEQPAAPGLKRHAIPEQEPKATATTESPAVTTTSQKPETQGSTDQEPKSREISEQEPKSTADRESAVVQTTQQTSSSLGTKGQGVPEQESKLQAALSTETVETSSQTVKQEISPPEPQFQYIIQVGSFVDKQTAEFEQQKLKRRGYNAIVKPIKHQVLGRVYVVQLKPVDNIAKASTLMTQLENAEQAKPVLIKVPAN